MSKKFTVMLTGPNGEFARLFPEPNTGPNSQGVAGGFFEKIEDEGETEDWIQVNSFLHLDDDEPKRGWVPSWAVGDPVPDLPQVLMARSLTFAAARKEADMAAGDGLTVSSEYLIALFLIENGHQNITATIGKETSFLIKDIRPNPDAISAYAVTTQEWTDFLAVEGTRLGWLPQTRLLPLPQMRCAAFLTRRDWEKFALLRGGTATNPFLPRQLDLFMSRIVGVAAAVNIAKREADGAGLTDDVTTAVRAANGWFPGSPEETALIRDRAHFLMNGAVAVDVRTFIARCREALDAGLSLGHKMLQTFIPGFIVSPAPSGALSAEGWITAAEEEFAAWKAGGWSEKTDPGQQRALSYFGATNHGPGAVTSPTGEITHWCGAFVAFCLKKAGVPVPKDAATAAIWAKWGDMSFPTAHGSPVPKGAIVTLAGSGGTSGHVCFFEKWEDGGRTFIGLGGNQGDKVSKAPHKSEDIVKIRMLSNKTASSGDDLMILAKTLFGEIRGGNDDQIRNVANVILNRFLTQYRSHGSIAGTCLADKQFSCWNLGTRARRELDKLPDTDADLVKLKAIAQAVIEKRLADGASVLPLQGARHYHNHKVNPDWAIPSHIVHDDKLHIFYKGIP